MKEGTGEGPLQTSSSADLMKPWATNFLDSESEDAAEDSQTEGSLESQDGRVVGCHTSRPWVRNEPPVVSRMCTRAQSRKQAAAETECDRV
ncbi:hypothetical protein CBL_20138 [Carabus blaptoides fortunei]